MVLVVHLCKYAKNHWIEHFKWMNFTICKLFLKKLLKNIYIQYYTYNVIYNSWRPDNLHLFPGLQPVLKL